MKLIWISFGFILLAPPKGNRLLLSREVVVELKESWKLLAETQIATFGGGDGLRKKNSRLSLLKKIRNFFQKFPNAEF